MAMGLRQPVGVVGAIAPWNAALILSLRSITAPLVLGNTVVLKPSEWSPISGGTLWGEVFAEAGLPAGVLNIVTHAPGEAAGVGDELVENPAVRRLNFTGSTADGPTAGGGVRASAEAGRPRARRLEPADRARRRGSPVRGRRGRLRRPSCIRGRSACRRGGSSWSARSPTHSPRSSSRRPRASRSATRRSTTRSSAR